MVFEEIVDTRTRAQTDGWTIDDGQWAITKAHLEHFVLRGAKKPLGHYHTAGAIISETPHCASYLTV